MDGHNHISNSKSHKRIQVLRSSLLFYRRNTSPSEVTHQDQDQSQLISCSSLDDNELVKIIVDNNDGELKKSSSSLPESALAKIETNKLNTTSGSRPKRRDSAKKGGSPSPIRPILVSIVENLYIIIYISIFYNYEIIIPNPVDT